MASYDPYDRDYPPRRPVREDRRDDRDPRFLDSRDYGRPHPSRELVPRGRQDSDLSVEEVRRDFPPPSGRDMRRARSADMGYYEEDFDPRYDRPRDHDRHRGQRGPGSNSSYHDDDDRRSSKHKSMTKQEKIIAAVAGAALLAGGKELYDRHEAKQDGVDVHRNPLSSLALAGFGALAGYQGAEFYSKQQAKKDQKANMILHRGRDGQLEYASDEDDDPRNKKGHKNFLESALAATGLGAAVKTLTGGGSHDEKHSDARSHRGSREGSRAGSRSRSGGGGANKIQKAAMASLLAGATEAFRVAKEPGGWKGEKAKRVLTAAAGAATVDAAQKEGHGKLGLAESVIGGLVGNRLINGSKRDIEEDKLTGRSRSRSRARSAAGGGRSGSGLAALATAGLGALGAKAALDGHSRSRSRGRSNSYDSREGSPDRHRRSRSRSVVDKARSSLAKLGIGAGGAAAADDHRRRDQDDFDDRGPPPRRSRGYADDYDDDNRYDGGRSRGHDYDYDRSRGGGGGGSRRRDRSRSAYTSESDLGDSDEDTKKIKKTRGKQIITTGLATVATIHAAHGVFQSMEKRVARQKAVKEGRLSAAEAKKLKTKAIIKDAGSIGIAAMGIKGAIEEMKEAKEMQHHVKEVKEECHQRHIRRELKRQKHRGDFDDKPRRAESWPAPPPQRIDYGPRYYDDNPYGAVRPSAPPLGYGP